MPEIGEVARVVHYLRKRLLNRTITTCEALEDANVYGKVGTSATAFQKHTEGRKVTGAAQQGKYFYVTFDKAPHAVMHLGMTGWVKFNTEDTAYYKQAKEVEREEEEWPPKYMKFLWKFEPSKVDGEDKEAVEVAFVDSRRFARIRLVDCEADKIRDTTPLKENGPDPVQDKAVVTVEWLTELLQKKKVPVKALLLDQANLSGVGNWVADEVLYQARIHPEQYCNTFDDKQIKQLHDSLIGVCTTAVETLADSKQFPEDWLMKYRWDKGKKESNVLPNGEKIVHLTVGGRTSAVVPSRQKKTAAVAGDVKSDEMQNGDAKPAKGRKRKQSDENEDEDEAAEKSSKAPKAKRGGRAAKKADTNGVKEENEDEDGEEPQAQSETETKVKANTAKKVKAKASNAASKKAEKPATPGSRRSTRNKP
ncbi:uncharacterized protein LTR77_009479 [Saxophila tyrrhenica]|uniref:Formamidopyrimidine-DNA glycosylase catalytic domain-containing protein n=1 Tax=Saxophila tyrrhenica TaxID=1690608 RepID=A0AAV9P1V2_9PEZI|nr:hypothetical protein LTR77_009479 [Saxophila tyrrhenica]